MKTIKNKIKKQITRTKYIYSKLSKKTKVYITVVMFALIMLCIGITLAFFTTEVFGGLTNATVNTANVVVLEFSSTGDLEINADFDNLAPDNGNLSDTITGTATLSSSEASTKSYYIYFNITNNEFIYTTESEEPELILTITDENEDEVTSLSDLTYVTLADGTSGFDVTTAEGLYAVALNHLISTDGTNKQTVDNWTFTLTFVNLDTNQYGNASKSFTSQLIMQDEEVTQGISVSSSYEKITNYSTASASLTSLECSSGDYTWNYKYNSIDIKDFDAITTCEIVKEDATEYDTISDHIMDLAGVVIEDVEGYVVHETYVSGSETVDTGYRYEGNDPNNYVYFNGEVWRIIGVFETYTVDDDGTVSSEPEMLTKLIDPDGIGSYAWDSSYNEWGGYSDTYDSASLYKILNNDYYNSSDGTASGYCYLYSSSVVGDCNFTESGISDGYRDLIENVVWYTGGIADSSYASAFYEAERGTTVYNSTQRSTTATGYIGLMYMSDYGYSVLESSCSRTTSVGSYNSASCAGSSWMMFGGILWTLVPGSSYSSYVWYVSNTGYASSSSANYGYVAHPVLYLNSDAKIIGGDGSFESPYVLSIV